jgi:hypothetical protein
VKRISKKVRDEAALICAIAASSGPTASTWSAQETIFPDSFEYCEAGVLARLALASTSLRFQGSEAYAEAEAMLRTGWSP